MPQTEPHIYSDDDNVAKDDVEEEKQTFLDNSNHKKREVIKFHNNSANDHNQQKENDIKKYTSLELNHSNDSRPPPIDRYNIVLFILIIHGIGTLMPWNMFINAEKYFTEYKLSVNTSHTNHTHHNSTIAITDDSGDSSVSSYRNYFLSYVGLAAQVPNIAFNALNLFFQFGGGNLTLRITVAIVVEAVIFITTIILAMIDSSSWPGEFFYLTMLTVVILNIANGVYQNSVYGLAAKLPMKYSNAVVLGSNISGTFTSIINIISIALSPNLRVAAIYYFLTALLVLLACFDTYFALPLNKFYRYYCVRKEEDTYVSTYPPFWFIFKKIWVQCFNVFMVFFVTLSIFPAIHAGIKPSDPEFFGSREQTDKYFTAVTCFLVFNLFAMIGNLFPNWVTIPGPKYLWIPVVFRLVLIPFFLFCNFQFSDESLRKWPVLIHNDYAFIAGGVVLGLSSGYLSSLCMMYAPKCVPKEHAGTAGMMAATFLILGIVVGINFSFVFSVIVKKDWF